MISDIRERAGDQLPSVLLKIILVYMALVQMANTVRQRNR
jgi:hypothetical protein